MTIQLIKLNIGGMTCGGCVKSIQQSLIKTVGVIDAKASLENNQVGITFDNNQTSIDKLHEVIEDIGFDILE